MNDNQINDDDDNDDADDDDDDNGNLGPAATASGAPPYLQQNPPIVQRIQRNPTTSYIT